MNRNIWIISIIFLIFVALPVTVLIVSCQETPVQKPVSFYYLVEYHPTFGDFEAIETRTVFWHTDDRFYRLAYHGKYYYDAPKHTYQVAQTISLPYGVNYITKYVRAQICEHGEYRHVATCCPKELSN